MYGAKLPYTGRENDFLVTVSESVASFTGSYFSGRDEEQTLDHLRSPDHAEPTIQAARP